MSRCDTCRTELVGHCLRCGAPQCCPLCCAVARIAELEAEREKVVTIIMGDTQCGNLPPYIKGVVRDLNELQAIFEKLPILVYVCTAEGKELVARLASAKDIPPFDVAYDHRMTWEMDSTRSAAEASINAART